MTSEQIPKLVVLQRVRNRLIEYLELVADAGIDTPHLKTSDIVNMWEDWVIDMPQPAFPSPPYSPPEALALAGFSRAWLRFCDETPFWPASYDELFAHPAWPEFNRAAASTLAMMRLRGLSDEDCPESSGDFDL